MPANRGLGRGLGALIPDSAERPPDAAPPAHEAPPEASAPTRAPATEVDIDRVALNPRQPRMTVDLAALDELTESVREHGIIQPLLVSLETTEDGAEVYQLIAGERRLRAARAAGLQRVPVTVRQTTPREQLELAIIENVQRADLSPLEEALAYQRLVEEFALTQQQVADRVGKSRVAVTNTMRLLDLSEEMRASLARGEISEGHARALLGIPDPDARRVAWRRIVEDKLNVRQAEQLARELTRPAPTPAKPRDPDLDAVADALRRSLGTKVTLRRSKRGTGSLTVHFYSNEEFEGVLDRLLGGEAI